MKKLLLIILLFSLFSGCDLFRVNCDSYCDGNVLHDCEQSQGGIGSSDNWSERDCSKEGKVCTSTYSYPRCVYDPVKCDEGAVNFCTGNTVFNCESIRGNIYANQGETCSDGKVCVEISYNAECFEPVDECDPKPYPVCINNIISTCYEANGEFYATYNKDCKEEKCVELGDGNTDCLTPVDECDPEPYSVCINNKISSCYENDGDFYATYNKDCKEQACVEFENGNANCLTPVDECIPTEKDVCIENTVGRCYEIDDEFYLFIKNDCGKIDLHCLELEYDQAECVEEVDTCNDAAESICYEESVSKCVKSEETYYVDIITYCYSNECIYDPETKSAHCLSDEN